MLRAAIRGPDRQAGQVEAFQDVRVHELRSKVEGQDVELPGRPVGVHGEQRKALAAQHLGHVGPRRVAPFGLGVGPFVQDLVQDLETLIGKAYLVGVRVEEEPGHRVGVVVRDGHPVLTSDVAGRFLHLGQDTFEFGPERTHDATSVPTRLRIGAVGPSRGGTPWLRPVPEARDGACGRSGQGR